MEVLQWTDKQNEVDTVDAHDINNIAHNLIEPQNKMNETEEQVGDIEVAIDNILEIQNSFILPSAEDVTF